jgi:hypothetical protein
LKGNFHDQFLEGWVGAIPPGYSADGENHREQSMNGISVPTLRQYSFNLAESVASGKLQPLRNPNDLNYLIE